MKRKLLATGLLFALLLSTTACGATAESTGQDTNNDTASASEITEAEDTTAEDTTEELPQVANLELTEGVVNGNRYENDSFGVAFTIPEGFKDLTTDFKTTEHLEFTPPGYNPDYSLQEYTIGDQTYYGILAYANDGGTSSYRIENVYIIRDNKVMNIYVFSMGEVVHYDNSTETNEPNLEAVEQYTQEILNSLELK